MIAPECVPWFAVVERLRNPSPRQWHCDGFREEAQPILQYVLDLAVGGRADDRLGDSGAVHHLLQRYRKRRAAVGRLGKGLEHRAREVDALRLPDLELALDRLELAVAEQARAPLIR